MKILVFVFLWFLYTPLASAGLCEERSREWLDAGKQVLACNEVDFGVRAISADYQKRQTEPVSIYPDRLKLRSLDGTRPRFAYVNEIPGIRNSLRYNPITDSGMNPSTLSSRGHSLLYKFNLALLRNPSLRRDQEMMKWLRDPESGLLSDLIPDSGALYWEGRCDVWAAWSIDPEVRRALDQNGEAVLCHDVPFSRGELKELVTVLYSRSQIERRLKLKGIFGGAPGVYGASLEDVNLALMKLGEFGRGSDFTPDQILDLGLQAKKEGKSLIFDIDPGDEIWNQPIEAIADLVFEDGSKHLAVEPGMAHYQSTSLDTSGLREKLFSLESALVLRARKGRQEAGPELCIAARALSEPCPVGPLWLSEQVDFLRKYQKLALDRGLLVYSGAPIERHAIVFQYGVEGSFAVSQDQPSMVKVVEYTRIGNDYFWSPSSQRLSSLCEAESGTPALVREERNSLIAGISLGQMCASFKKDPSKDRNLFLGALPPGKIEYFRAISASGDDVRVRLYRSFLRLLEQCQGVDSAVAFLKDFETTMSVGAMSGSRVEYLASRFREELPFLEPKYFQDRLRREIAQGFSLGFDALLKELQN
ncbi:MAG: hypothetical protein KGP28_04430 [Bdellovibrionales bacterium]|nr:hypothetical protein [Bdellovibrionales bacterium]